MNHSTCGNCPFLLVDSIVDCICTRLSIQTTFVTAICAWRRAEIASPPTEGKHNGLNKTQTVDLNKETICTTAGRYPKKNTSSVRRMRSTHALAQALPSFGLPGLQPGSPESASVHDSDDAGALRDDSPHAREHHDETKQGRNSDAGIRNVSLDGKSDVMQTDLVSESKPHNAQRVEKNTPTPLEKT
jgi:hypothetical protein